MIHDGPDPLPLGEALAARLCHDFAGLAGTIQGAIDLLPSHDEATAIARDAAVTLSARLVLLRACWGGGVDRTTRGGLAALVEPALAERGIILDLDGLEAGAGLDAAWTRIALNLLLVGAEAVPSDGRVVLAGRAGGQLILVAEGHGAAWPTTLTGLLAAAPWTEPPAPAECAPLMLALTARSLGIRLSFLLAGGSDQPAPLLASRAPAAG